MTELKKGIDISGAKVISEEKKTDPLEQETKAISPEEKEYMKNLEDQEEVTVSEVLKTDTEEKIKIDYLNPKASLDYTASKSKISNAKPEEEKVDITGDPKQTSQIPFTKVEDPSEYKDDAEFIIMVIDWLFSKGMSVWAKDTSDFAYSAPKPKQTELAKKLAPILAKYKRKFPIEAMFVVALLAMYVPGIMKAYNRRKEIKRLELEQANTIPINKSQPFKDPVEKVKKPEEKPLEYKQYETIPAKEELEREIEIPNEMETHFEDNPEVTKRKYAPLKKKKGGQRKM